VAAVAALACYVIIGVGAAFEPALGWLWLLRQPAGSAVGMFALTAMPADWWSRPDKDLLLLAVGVLAAIGVGYLLVEASNHGVRSRRALLRRTGGVTLTGFLHAFLISVIGLRFLVPAFAAPAEGTGTRMSCWWISSGCGDTALSPWLLVLAATAWSFVAGVLLQIIWDDQPITAPLAHVSWRHGR
jgi:hypothetical protein